MKCSNCGFDMGEGIVFCSKCGTVTEEGQKEVPVYKPIVVPEDTEQANSNAYVSPYKDETMAVPYQDTEPYTIGAPKPRKTRKKFFIFGGAGIILVACALLVFFNFEFVSNVFAKTFLSAEKYYKYVEEKALNSACDQFSETYGTFLGSLDLKESGAESDVTVTLCDEIYALIEAETDIDFSEIGSITLHTETSMKNGLNQTLLSLLLDKDSLLSGSIISDIENNNLFVKLDGMTEDYLKLPLSTMINEEETLGTDFMGTINGFLEKAPNQELVNKIMKKYSLLLIQELNDVTKDSGSISAGNMTAEYTTLLVKINEDTLTKTFENILSECKKDTDVKKLIIDIAGQDAYESFLEGVEKVSDGIDVLTKNFPGAKMTLYVDSEGCIRGREIEVAGASLVYAMIEKDGLFSLKYGISAGGEDVFLLDGYGTCKKEVYNGTFKVTVNNESILTFTAEDVDCSKAKDGISKGRISFPLPAEAGEMLPESLQALGDTFNLVIDFETSKDTSKFGCSLTAKKYSIVDLTLSTKKKEAATIKIPDNAIEDTEEWLTTFDIEKLMETLRNSKLPSELVDMFEMLSSGDMYEF